MNIKKCRYVFLALLLGFGRASAQDTIPREWRRELSLPERIRHSKEVLYRGKPTTRFELNSSDKMVSNGKRTEIATPAEDSVPVERYYSFRIYLPKREFVADSIPEIVAQWHAQPDVEQGETWRSPPIALSVRNGRWWLTIRWASAPVNTNKTLTGMKVVDLGPCGTNRWTSWKFHIRFSYGDDGLLEVRKDKEPVFSRSGPNYYNDKKGPFFKFGIYKWGWNDGKASAVTRRVLYFSDVKIGKEAGTGD